MELAAEPDDRRPSAGAVVLGELRLDPRREAAFYADRPLALTGGEFELLLLLASRSSAVSSIARPSCAPSVRAGGPGGDAATRSANDRLPIRRKLREAGARCRWRSRRSTATAMRCVRADDTGREAYKSAR